MTARPQSPWGEALQEIRDAAAAGEPLDVTTMPDIVWENLPDLLALGAVGHELHGGRTVLVPIVRAA